MSKGSVERWYLLPVIIGAVMIVAGTALLSFYPQLLATTVDELPQAKGGDTPQHPVNDTSTNSNPYPYPYSSSHSHPYTVIGTIDAVERLQWAQLPERTVSAANESVRHALVRNETLSRANFTRVTFDHLLFVNVTFSHCRFQRVQFNHIRAIETRFVQCEFENCTFFDLRFVRADSVDAGDRGAALEAVTRLVIDGVAIVVEPLGEMNGFGLLANEPKPGTRVLCTLRRAEVDRETVAALHGATNATETSDGVHDMTCTTHWSEIQPVWIVEAWLRALTVFGAILVGAALFTHWRQWDPQRFWPFFLPFLFGMGGMLVLYLWLPWNHFLATASGMMIYIVPPAGKETIIPTLTLLTGAPAAAALALAFVDIAGAWFLLGNFWLIESLPLLGRWLRRTERAGESFLAKHPRFKRGAFLAVTLFVLFPFQGSGGWGATVLGRVIGLRRRKIFVGVLLGTLVGNFIIAYIVYYMGIAFIDILRTDTFKYIGLIVVALVGVAVAMLVVRARRKKNATGA